MNTNTFLQDALAHARQRWCWDDRSFIEELYRDRPPGPNESAQAWINSFAEEFDLIDPYEYGR